MNPIASIASVLLNLSNFRGRASRGEFWWFFVIALVAAILVIRWFSNLLGLTSLLYMSLLWFLPVITFLLPAIYLVVMPAVTVRRLHDTGRSARWLLFPVIFIVGWGIIVGVAALGATFGGAWESVILPLLFIEIWSFAGLIMMVPMTLILALPGTRGPNRYGPDPLRPELGSEWVPQPEGSYDAPPETASSRPVGEEPPAPVVRQFCTQCGGQLQAGARFCSFCGSAV